MKKRLFILTVLLVTVITVTASAGDLSGRLLSGDGAAVSEGCIVVARSMETGRVFPMATDVEGRFHGSGIPAGTLLVQAFSTQDPRSSSDLDRPVAAGKTSLAMAAIRIPAEGRAEITLRTSPQAGTFDFKLYQGRYYDNRSEMGAADPVSVGSGATVPGINFALPTGGGFISGRVTSDAGGAPLPGLIVVALGRNDLVLSFDRTDSDGRYRISGIPADNYLVSVNAFLLLDDNDYVAEFYNSTNDITLATNAVVTNGVETQNINFGLALGGSIRGRVTAEAGGAPLPFAAVTARSTGNALLFSTTLADANGDYAVRGLKAGTWTVSADAEGNFLTEYYNNRASAGTADPVTVISGIATSGINLSLPAGGAISGTIRDQGTLAALEGRLVEATRISDFLSRTAETGPDGTYRIEGLPTGTYRVGVPVLTRWYNNRSSAETADPISVSAGTTATGINISGFAPGDCTPGVGAMVTGTITGSGAPLAGTIVEMWRTIGNQRIPGDETETAGDGTFAFPCLDAGTWFARVHAPFTEFLPRWYDNADSAGATAIPLINGVPRGGINLNLLPGASISGRVTAADSGSPLHFAEVFAKSTAPGAPTAAVLTDENGDYVLNSSQDGGLSAGSYIVWTNNLSTADPSLVPVKLVRFAAEVMDDDILVSWEIGAEEAGTSFLLDRAASDDGEFDAPVCLTERPVSGGTHFSHRDTGVVPGTLYRYDLMAIDRAGAMERLGQVTIRAGASGTSRILSVVPNPLRESTTIRFSLPEAGPVAIRIFDTNGRLIRTLVDAVREAGGQDVMWDGRSDSGARVGAGVYYVALRAGGAESRVRVVLAR